MPRLQVPQKWDELDKANHLLAEEQQKNALMERECDRYRNEYNWARRELSEANCELGKYRKLFWCFYAKTKKPN